MPKTTKSGKAIEDELPSTLQRSDQHAKQVFAKTYDSAMDQYDDEQRAHQTAFASLKHTHEKVGDHWEPKEEFGPSDARAEEGRDPIAPPPGAWTPTPARSISTNSPPGWTSRAGRP